MIKQVVLNEVSSFGIETNRLSGLFLWKNALCCIRTIDERGVMTNNDIVPGFDDEKDESLKIKLQKVSEVEGSLVL
jgi:hypothetical protein